MITSMPFPIGFAIPPGWRTPQPPETGSPLGMVAAVRPEPAAVITAGGEFRPDDASLPEIAGESVHALRESGAMVDVLQRTEVGIGDSPGLSQVLLVRDSAAPDAPEVVQCQAFLALLDVEDRGKRVVLRFVMTTTRAGASALVDDFRQFLGSIRPVPGTDRDDRDDKENR